MKRSFIIHPVTMKGRAVFGKTCCPHLHFYSSGRWEIMEIKCKGVDTEKPEEESKGRVMQGVMGLIPDLKSGWSLTGTNSLSK